jgi:hypothetical protein
MTTLTSDCTRNLQILIISEFSHIRWPIAGNVRSTSISSRRFLGCNAVQGCGRSGTLVSYHNTIRRHNPENFNSNVSEIHVSNLWVISLHPEDGGQIVLRNVGILPQHYAASKPRRPRLESSLPWKSQMSHHKDTATFSGVSRRDFLGNEFQIYPFTSH